MLNRVSMASPDLPFKALPNRDAFATIRGFFYQINATIHQWLELEPETCLELEAGEDIDIVRLGITGSEFSPDRLLQQIKDVGRPISLKSADAMASLVRFFAHEQLNPTLRLAFRFITTARPAKEHLPTGQQCQEALITFRSELRKGNRSDKNPCLGALREVLISRERQDGFEKPQWDQFQDFVSSASTPELLSFISKIEWSTEQPINSLEQAEIKKQPVSQKLASSSVEAERIYPRLVVRVIDTLSRPGVKRLTRQDISSSIQNEPLSEPQLLNLNRVEEMLSSLHAEFIEQGHLIRQMSAAIGRTENGIGIVLRNQQKQSETDYSPFAQIISFERPIPVSKRVSRDRASGDLLRKLCDGVWLSVIGPAGSGKTQLALEIAELHGKNTLWIGLKGRSTREALSYLARALSTLGGNPINPTQRSDLETAVRALPHETLIVVDDLPQSDTHEELERCLSGLASATAQCGIHLLTTSLFKVPRKTKDSVGNLSETLVPAFTEEEIVSLLRRFDAPENLLRGLASTLKALTQGDPTLVRAAIQFLSDQRWKLESTLTNLLTNRFAEDVDRETTQLLGLTVPNDDARQLLYRLKILGPRFNSTDVRLAADAPPIIPLPIEKLEVLTGLWIERDSESEYLISPRVMRLPGGNLQGETECSIHVNAANVILKKGTLGPLDVLKAVTHFQAVRDTKSVARVLLTAFRSLALLRDAPADDWGITALWSQVPLPAELAIEDCIMLRTAQILALRNLKKDAQYEANDLDRLLSVGAVRSPEILLPAAMAAALELVEKHPVSAVKLVLKTAETLRQETLGSSKYARRMRSGRTQILWYALFKCRDNDSTFVCLETLLAFPDIESRSFANNPIAFQVAVVVVDEIWHRESDLPEADRRWAELLKRLETLTASAVVGELWSLVAALTRARVIVLAEYLNALDAADQLSREIAVKLANEPAAEFTVALVIGQEHFIARDFLRAEPWLRRAIELEAHGETIWRVYAFLYGGVLKASTSSREASILLGKAYELSEASADIPEILKVRILAEDAIIVWKADGLRSAYPLLRHAVDRLVTSDLSSPRAKSLFRLFGNTLAYFGEISTDKSPSEGLKVPHPGMYLDLSTEFADLFEPSKTWLLEAYIAQIAESLRLHSDAAKFAAAAIGRGSTQISEGMRWFLIRYVVAGKLAVGEYRDALSLWGEPTAVPALGIDAHLVLAILESLTVGLAFFLARSRVSAPQSFDILLESVVDSCNSVKGEYASKCALIAGLLRRAFDSKASGRELIDAGGKSEDGITHVCFYVGAMSNLSPRDAFRAQEAVLPWLQRHRDLLGGIFVLVIIPFFRQFWRDRFNRDRIHFLMPRLVERDIEDALSREGEDSLVPLFAAVSKGLGVNPLVRS